MCFEIIKKSSWKSKINITHQSTGYSKPTTGQVRLAEPFYPIHLVVHFLFFWFPFFRPVFSSRFCSLCSSPSCHFCFVSFSVVRSVLPTVSCAQLSLIVFTCDMVSDRSFKPMSILVFVSAGSYCIVLIRRQRAMAATERGDASCERKHDIKDHTHIFCT